MCAGLTLGCANVRLPLWRHDPAPELIEEYCSRAPVAASPWFEVYHVPPGVDPKEVLAVADRVAKAVTDWLGAPRPPRGRLLVFSPKESGARSLVGLRRVPHGAGITSVDTRLIVVVAEPGSDRLLDVLCHEVAHDMLLAWLGRRPAFWIDEGVATLFERGVDAAGRPRPSPERLALCRYLLDSGESPPLEPLVRVERPRLVTGRTYAWCWAVTSCLYLRDPERLARLLKQTAADPTDLSRRLWPDDASLERFAREVEAYVLEGSGNGE